MSGYVRLQVTVPHDSGVPRDSVVYTTHWIHADPSAAVGAVAASAVTNFDAFLTEVADKVSTQYNPSAATYKTFNMLDPEPRIPLSEGSITAAPVAPASIDLPAEVALVISYEALPVSGLNQRRRRGRIYFGPLAHPATDAYVPPDAYVDELAEAAWNNFVIPSGSDGLLAVFSGYTAKDIPVGGTPTEDDDDQPELVPGSFAKVERLWVDNAWDTQRRRGIGATRREVYSA